MNPCLIIFIAIHVSLLTLYFIHFFYQRLAGATLLVFANKQDLPGALSKDAIREVSLDSFFFFFFFTRSAIIQFKVYSLYKNQNHHSSSKLSSC